MKQYLDLMRHVIDNGHMVQTRNGNRLTVYGAQLRFDLTKGFPLMTTKKVNFAWVAGELCWFLSGQTNTNMLHEWGIPIWDANADADGNLGRIYGAQWRSWEGSLDQVWRSLRLLQTAPASTRNVVTAWNPTELDAMKLPPCHFAWQVHAPDDKVILQASMRSVDLCLGLPFNIASYALLAHILAHRTGRVATELIMDLGNIHIYEAHIPNAQKQLSREPRELPVLRIESITTDLMMMEPAWFTVSNYDPHPFIKYEIFA